MAYFSPNPLPLKIIVIGGGAAGFFAAICCSQTHPQAQVTLLEASHRPLAKVLVSGGGRCNVTHACFEPALLVQNYPRGSKALRGAFSKFQPRDTIAWFTHHGIPLKTEADGRVFPVSDRAETIVDCLLEQARSVGVQLRLHSAVQSVCKSADQFQLTLKSGEVLQADRLLIATGSSAQGYQFAQSLGHSLVPPVPSLFTFNVSDDRLTDLAGISVNSARLRVQLPPPTTASEKSTLEQTGPLLITHWGLSGPVVLKLSAWGARALHHQNYQAPLTINWLPHQNPDHLRQELQAVRAQIPQRTVQANCPVMLPRRLWERLTDRVGIQAETRWAELSNKVLNLLLQELTQGSYTLTGKGVFKEEFVTCGGVTLKEVDFKTMASRCCPGLYFAGEVLDIDGVTGGFNFQSAWTTGWLAGQAIGQTTN